ncbi:MAG: nucleoside triphosphate pyrophosphatase [Bdellovibrionales bacterium]
MNFDTLWLFDYGLNMEIILASTSPYRQAQLSAFGIHFRAVAPRVDEEALKKDGPTKAFELSQFLAKEKAASIKSTIQNALILGGDQVLEFENQIFSKPGNKDAAFHQLKQMQGKSHRLISSLAVESPLHSQVYTDVTTIKLRELSDADIQSYLEQDRPFDCAGSYKMERAGMALVDSIDSKDPSSIQGIPLLALTQALLECGLDLPQFWSSK